MGSDTATAVPGRTLADPALFARLTAQITRTDPAIDTETAERIADQAFAFLATCADREETDEALTPSVRVDIGWHTFLLRTREYQQWCARHAGRFLHHNPHDGVRGAADPHAAQARAVAAIRRAGYHVDEELWSADADCSQGGGPAPCGDDGRGGNPPPGHPV